jgi:hypothetical protein
MRRVAAVLLAMMFVAGNFIGLFTLTTNLPICKEP